MQTATTFNLTAPAVTAPAAQKCPQQPGGPSLRRFLAHRAELLATLTLMTGSLAYGAYALLTLAR